MAEMWHTVQNCDDSAPRDAFIRSASLDVAGGTIHRTIVSNAEGVAVSQIFVPNPPPRPRLSQD